MTPTTEHMTTPLTFHEQWTEFMEEQPITVSTMISRVVPSNQAEERAKYLAGETDRPHHAYDKLVDIDDEMIDRIQRAGEQVLNHPAMDVKYREIYETTIAACLDRARMLKCMRDYTVAESQEEKQRLKEEFMTYNERLFGKPDEGIYRSILKEKIEAIQAKELTGKAAELREELMAQVGDVSMWRTVERFHPSQETVAWAHEMVVNLYEGMLRHIPEDVESFDVAAIKDIFEAVLRDEFGEAADGWRVDIEPASVITVKANEKRIIIPESRKPASRAELRKLVCHELGVHFLRSIMGGDTDLDVLAIGAEGYYDPEEGMGAGTEQALEGKYTEAGLPAYLTIGAMYFDAMSFDDVVNLKWKLALLGAIKPGEDVQESAIAAKRSAAYDGVMRVVRGTDELPWFKDLGYNHGSAKYWQKMEEICGDEFQFALMMIGRTDYSSRQHRNVVLETRTV